MIENLTDGALEVFEGIISKSFIHDEEDIENSPAFSELLANEKIIIKEASKDVYTQIINKINDGEYQCVERPASFNDDDSGKDDDLSLLINEQIYSISYRSSFDDIRSDHVHHVDIKGKFPNSVFTIAEAIAASIPGETIYIHPGTYCESLVIDKSLELKQYTENGDHIDYDACVIKAREGGCILQKANCSKIVGIKLICSTPGDTYCARCDYGRLELESCNLIANCAGCVRSEPKAQIYASKCRFESDKHPATSLTAESRSIFDSCIFCKPNNDDNSIVVDAEATCIVSECKEIRGTIVFRSRSKGMIKNSEIKPEKGPGIIIHDDALPLIKDSHIINCQTSGIILEAGSKAVINNSIIEKNNDFGILARASRGFLITNSTVAENTKGGIRIAQGASGKIINSKIEKNHGSGGVIIEICTKSQLEIRHCNIQNNDENGIFIKDPKPTNGIELSILDSSINGNQHGIACSVFAKVKMCNSKIFQNHNCGVFFKYGDIYMTNCYIHNNEANQIRMVGQSRYRVSGSNLESSDSQAALYISESAEGEFKNSNFKDNKKVAVAIRGDSKINLTNCSFQSNYTGIFSEERSYVECTKTKIINNFIAILSKGNSKICFNDSLIEKGNLGIEASYNSSIIVRNSTFITIPERAMFFEGKDVSASIIESKFAACGQTSIHCKNGTQKDKIKFDKCLFEGLDSQALTSSSNKTMTRPVQYCFQVTQNSGLQIYNSIIKDFQLCGIEITDNSELEMSKTKIFQCGRTCVMLERNAKAKIESNNFGPNHMYGIILKGNSSATIKNNLYGMMRNDFIEANDTSKVEESDNIKACE